jgi:hypothetical protein
MMKTGFAALGVLAMMSGSAFAAPPPNDVGVTGMGGGVYFNPDKVGQRSQSDRANDRGTAAKGGGDHHTTTSEHG